jgi:hypothetical protein
MAEPLFLQLADYADVQKLVADGIEENLNLDYKASPSLARDDKQINEMCKDASAFANSAGGQLVYGITEDRATRKPTEADPGVTDPKISREWIEQVLNSRIQPRINNIRTVQIDNKKGGSIFVVTVPPSQTGPHQAPDKKYYKRFDLQSVAMEDYEIKDVMRRATTPHLALILSFARGNSARIDYERNTEMSKPVELVTTITNHSPQPAAYAIIDVGIDNDLTIISNGDFRPMGEAEDDRNIPMNWYRYAFQPPRMPIFKEHTQSLVVIPIQLGFQSDLLQGERLFDFAVRIAAPGFVDTSYWTARSRGGILQLYPPDHQFTRTR